MGKRDLVFGSRLWKSGSSLRSHDSCFPVRGTTPALFALSLSYFAILKWEEVKFGGIGRKENLSKAS